MCSAWGGGGVPRRVSPFRHPRIDGYVPLPAAFRSLSRLSSAPGAKASALCPSSLNRLHHVMPPASAPSVALPRVVPGLEPGSSDTGSARRTHGHASPRLPAAFLSLLDVRWGLPHRLVLFLSVFGFQGTAGGSCRRWARVGSDHSPPARRRACAPGRPLRAPESCLSCSAHVFERCSGGHLLSHAPWRSTIGRPRLDHRVRDGYGYFPQAHRHRNFF